MWLFAGGWKKKRSSAPMLMNGKVLHPNIHAHVSSSWHFDRCRHIVMSTISINVYHIIVLRDKFITMANKNKNVNFHLIELIGGFQVV